MVVLDYFEVAYIALVFLMLGMGIMHWAYSPEREELRELKARLKEVRSGKEESKERRNQ